MVKLEKKYCPSCGTRTWHFGPNECHLAGSSFRAVTERLQRYDIIQRFDVEFDWLYSDVR